MLKNRSGSYKKLLFDDTQLRVIAPLLSPIIKRLKTDYLNDLLSPQDFTTLYMLLFVRTKFQTNYIQFHKKQLTKSLSSTQSIDQLLAKYVELNDFEKIKLKNITACDLFQRANIKGLPLSVNRCMSNWYYGSWNIELMFKIPTSVELLKLQAKNKRALTVIVDDKKLSSYILGKRDPLSFVIHDLMHADQFFNNQISQKGQLGFYQMIDETPYPNELCELLKNNHEFKESFEYVISDMNAYIIHLLKSFKSCFSRINREDIFYQYLGVANIPENIILAIKKINQEILSESEENLIRHFFENKQDYL